jgi:hypothetical protein
MGYRPARRRVAGATDQPSACQLAGHGSETARPDARRQLDGGPHVVGGRGAAGEQGQQQSAAASTDQSLTASGQQLQGLVVASLALVTAGGG